MTPKAIREQLLSMQDRQYRDFTAKLVPNVDAAQILGVRFPEIKRIAKTLRREGEAEAFLAALPHFYLEENHLHAVLLSEMKNPEALFGALEAFLPFVDNWATCDTLRPAAFKKHLAELPGRIRQWLDSPHPYTIRFGVGMLMAYYLDDAFDPAYLEWVAALQSEEYYVNMMIAWYFATALAKQYDAAIPYLADCRLDRWCHNKTIQKAIESFRVTDEHKAFLRTLKIK